MISSVFHRSRFAALASLLALITVVLPLAVAPASGAEGQDWGPSGITTTESAATARWDNAGNADSSLVPRDETQTIPYTDKKTYTDIRPQIRTAYQEAFGPDNGYGGLSMTVSQTQDLVNQSITVGFTGLPTNQAPGDREVYMQLFQCWGAAGPDGQPDPQATAPDPATCQTGAGGADALGSADLRIMTAGDRLWNGEDGAPMPVQPIGNEPQTDRGAIDRYFNATTTNEHSKVRGDAEGKAQRAFEVQTTVESSFLGCGYTADAPSTDTCWLVAVPIDYPILTRYDIVYGGAISGLMPSVWAQRLQIKLGFQDLDTSCPNGRERTLTAGSELATYAMSSWIPGLCRAADMSLGYSQLSDQQARNQLTSGTTSAVLTTNETPTASSYAPIAVAGIAIGYSLDYLPNCYGTPIAELTEEVAQFCGYQDLATATDEIGKAGQQIRDLRLNARLIAKLLTETYGLSSGGDAPLFEKAPWLLSRFGSGGLLHDPEFIALNPQLKHHVGAAVNRLESESLLSDASAALWQWIVSDPNAHAFLSGCPDDAGMVINPWYSTRTYEGCESQALQLEATAKADRDATQTPSEFDTATPPSYPAIGASYPRRLYVQSDANELAGTATLVDLYPQVADQFTAARAAARAAPPRGQWCDDKTGGCSPALWKSSSTPQQIGKRTTFVITDTANASRYQLPTAALCGGEDECVAADPSTLTAEVDRWTVTSDSAPAERPTEVDYQGHAYPLTVPVYAAFHVATLDHAAAGTWATALEFITGLGQTSGASTGELKAGYLPLTPALVGQAEAAIATLRAVTDQVPTASVPNAIIAPPAFVPRAIVPPAVSAPGPANQSPNQPPADVPVIAGAETAATEIGFPQFGLLAGLGAALLSGAIVPIMGRKRRMTSE